jgi:thiaminase/transcriptional activator TenA
MAYKYKGNRLMTLSKTAWTMSAKIIQAIENHPFNQELMRGTLASDKFAYYIEQDSLYLQDFARCHALIASRVSHEYVRCFLRYSDYTFVAEQEIVHQYFRDTFHFQESGLLSPATLSYTSYLLRMCSTEAVEVGIAAVLPCFWIYREVGMYIARHAGANNPYSRWIETYSSDDFANSVNEAISIFDALADKAADATRQKMLDTFYKSTCLEWHFWNDAYYKIAFDDVNTNDNSKVPTRLPY